MSEDVCDLRFAKTRAVVFEREVALGVVELEAAKAVGVGKFAEGAELFVGERGLEFEFCFEKCHGEEYSRGAFERLKVDRLERFAEGWLRFDRNRG